MSRIFFDMANVMKRSLFVGKDAEFGFEVADTEEPGKKVWVNGWQYGFDNTLTLMHAALTKYGFTPKDVVLVFEGMTPTAVRAKKVQGGYSKGRKKRPNEVYKELGRLQEEIQKFWLGLGASSAVQHLVEADDVLAYLAQNSEEDCFIYSHDGDLTRLVGHNKKGFLVTVGNNDAINKNPFGDFPHDLITVYKSLVGDANDNIKGANGFGDAAFLKVLAAFGTEGLYEIEDLIRKKEVYRLQEDVETCKVLGKLVNDEQGVYDSYALASLYPEAVNTLHHPLLWEHGMVRDLEAGDDSRFRKWYGTRTLVHAGNFEKVIAQAEKMETPFVALDLETTTGEESDDWMSERFKRDSEAKVDVFGSEIVSCGLTFGDNLQHTLYLTHRHAAEEGIQQLTRKQLRQGIERVTRGKRTIAHNAQGFELPVLGTHFREAWADNGWSGFLPDVHCTKILASYVDENQSLGLKKCAKHYLDYDQETYQEVTTLVGPQGTLPPGGKLLEAKELEKPDYYDEDDPAAVIEKRQYKMHELPASHVFHYGSDDTIVTAALYNHFKLRTQLEGTWGVYCEVEQLPMYLSALGYIQGVNISLEEMRGQEKEDDAAYDAAWATLRTYLIEKGWEGTACPTYTRQIDAAGVKEAFQIVTGEEFDTKVRTPSKLAILAREQGSDLFAEVLEKAISGDAGPLNELVRMNFSGEPQLNLGSPKQLQALLYETMKLPVRIRNKPTEKMRKEGVREGTPKTDELAIESAIHFDADIAPVEALKALLTLKHIETRRKLFYVPYQFVQHWKDQKAHPQFNQCATVTRRHSCSDPNIQQLPSKTDGGKLRRIVKPHHPDAVIASMDFNGQELRLGADYSKDENMLSCYIGENKRDIHSIVAAGATLQQWGTEYSYDDFVAMRKGEDEEAAAKAEALRDKAKTVNFAEQYGAMAEKISQKLMVTEEEAQVFLDAKKAMFPGVDRWKGEVVEQLKELGYATTKLGARRHLAAALLSDNYVEASKAERQGPNFKIQGSGAEMTKLAMRRMWERGLHLKYDAHFIGPVHDEVVWSCAIVDLIPFLEELHWCMTQPYADMEVPIVSEITFGPSFGEQYSVGQAPDADKAIELLEKHGFLEEEEEAQAA